MSINSTQSLILGFLVGIVPGVLIGLVGLSLGGEWAWNLGLVGIWLIAFGFFAGPLLGSVGPEILAERPALSGAVIGAVPGIVFTVLRFDDAGWISVLAIFAGSAIGALVGHWNANRARPTPLASLGDRGRRRGTG